MGPDRRVSDGKQEIFWDRLESRLLMLLRGIEDLKSFINQAACAWVEQGYHRKEYKEIRTPPLQRMLTGPMPAGPGQRFSAPGLHLQDHKNSPTLRCHRGGRRHPL